MVGTVRKLERRHPYLLSSIVTAWYYPCVHFEVTIDTHCSQTVRLSHCSVNLLLRNSGKDGTAAAKYLSGHHCVDGKVLVSTTVMRGHMSVFHIIQQIVMRTDEYRMDISKDQENIGHVKDHRLWICHAT